MRQIPLEKDEERLPAADGVFRLTDGTLVRIKGGEGNFAGAPISGELDFGGVKVAYSARGLFAARVENGKLVAFCGGEVAKVEGGGISLKPGKAADISLSMSGAGNDGGGEWRGTYQTGDESSSIPEELLSVTRRWVRLEK